jgi:poly(3-hydroxybutyrate) depolymerase
MRLSRRVLWALLAVTLGFSEVAAAKTTKESVTSGGISRPYYLALPDKPPSTPMPLIVLLHGSGRDGKSLLTHWEGLGNTEGLILVGAEATVREGWDMRKDGPDFLYDLVESVKSRSSVDPKRVYLFGHSAGAVHALGMAVLESEYFAAVAVHAGVIDSSNVPFIERAPRKTPVGLWVGTRDPQFPVEAVRRTRDALTTHGFSVQLVEIPGHTHWYYDRAGQINKEVWAFLKQQALAGEPKYQAYDIPK